MAMHTKMRVTLDEFIEFIHIEENRDKRFELLNGEIIEVPSNPFVSVIASRIIAFITLYLMQNALKGYVSGEGGGFMIEGQVFAPDVAYMRDLPTNKGFEQTPPLLAIEVISDPHSNTEQTDLRRKLGYFMRAGVQVWVVDYVARQVEVHTPNELVQLFTDTDTLTGGAILPGFTLAVSDIFPPTEE